MKYINLLSRIFLILGMIHLAAAPSCILLALAAEKLTTDDVHKSIKWGTIGIVFLALWAICRRFRRA
jgi:hypothetical protein